MKRVDNYFGMTVVDDKIGRLELMDEITRMGKQFFKDEEYEVSFGFSEIELIDIYNGLAIQLNEKTIQSDGFGYFEYE